MKDYRSGTEEERAETFERFCKHLKYWAKYLSMNHWKIEVTHAHGRQEVRKSSLNEDPDFSGAVVNFDPSYEKADIVLCTQDSTHWDDRELEEMATHELVHLIWSAVTELIPDEVAKTQAFRILLEAATTHTTRVLIGAYANVSGLSRRPRGSSAR